MVPKNFGLVSIIIANYNNEKFIDRFMNLLEVQTYKNFELIVVDDGSVDQSIKRVEPYKSRMSIKIIRIDHEGVGVARDVGIQLAKGDFFMFLDVDDTFSKKHIESYVNELMYSKCDIALIPVLKNREKSFNRDEIVAIKELVQDILNGDISGWLHQIITKSWVWKKVSFLKNVDYAEDVFALKMIANEHPDIKVHIRGEISPTYVYEQNEASVTNSPSESSINKIITLNEIMGLKYTSDDSMQLFLKRQMIYAYSLSLRLGQQKLTRKVRSELLYGPLKKYLSKSEMIKVSLGLFAIKSRMGL